MKTITYWKSQCLNDRDVYSIRKHTKKEVVAELKDSGLERLEEEDLEGKPTGEFSWGRDEKQEYGDPIKVSVTYHDRLDLIIQAQGSEC